MLTNAMIRDQANTNEPLSCVYFLVLFVLSFPFIRFGTSFDKHDASLQSNRTTDVNKLKCDAMTSHAMCGELQINNLFVIVFVI